MRSATEAIYMCMAKMKILKDQKNDWSHFLVPLFGPTYWSHRPIFCGDLVKIGRESKCEENSAPIGYRSDVLSLGRQALYALGYGGFMLYESKITRFKHQNDDWSHFLVPLFCPTLLLQPTFAEKGRLLSQFRRRSGIVMFPRSISI